MAAFANQIALITGAGSGLGRQLALLLASEGAAIAAIDLQPEPLTRLANDLAGKPVAFRAITVVWPCARRVRNTATPAVVLPTSDEVPSIRYTGALRSLALVSVTANCRMFSVSRCNFSASA